MGSTPFWRTEVVQFSMLPPELQKITPTCPSCKKGVSSTLDVVFKKASLPCPHCKSILEFSAASVSRSFQSMGDVEKASKKIEEARGEYTKTLDRFKSALADLVKGVRVSS